MGCLFGYIGKPRQGLLDKMGQRLAHRCKLGVQKAKLLLSPHRVVEIGHGIPPWCQEQRVAVDEPAGFMMGYSGIIAGMNMEDILGGEGIFDRLEHNGPSALDSLEGSFVMAAFHKDNFYLLRDPAGIKGLYWTRVRERLLFASEIKALFADPLVKKEIRMGALPEYLTFSFIPGEATMFENIHELQPGHLLTFKNNRISHTRYFSFEEIEPARFEQENHYSLENKAGELRKLLEQSVSQCHEATSHQPAVFLSGGIDSSAVLAVMANLYPGKPIDTFSVHFGPQYVNENEFISMMSQKYRTRHTWLEIKPDGFLKRLNEIIWRLDDPIGDPITVPNYLLAEAASRVTPVVLNGEGGDPCFGGPKNIPMMLASLYGPARGQEHEYWLENNYLQSYRKCYDDLERLLNPDLFSKAEWEESLRVILRPFFKTSHPRSFLNKLMTINIRLKGANLILIKVDKMTSANGVLALAPLFSKAIIKSSMAIPPTLKLQGNTEKAILKMAVRDIVPAPIIQRPKSGMMVPVRFWFQKEMKPYTRRFLSRRKLKQTGFFNPDYVQKLIKYDLNDIHGMRYGTKLWMLVTFLLWHQQMVEKSL